VDSINRGIGANRSQRYWRQMLHTLCASSVNAEAVVHLQFHGFYLEVSFVCGAPMATFRRGGEYSK
jgi:hypothetical protein